MLKKIFLTSLAFMLLSIPTFVYADASLKNGSFEFEGAKSLNDAADWEVWTAERLDEFKRTGKWALHGWAFDGEGEGGAWQSISVTTGTKLTFSGYLMNPSEVGIYHKDPLKNGAEAFLEIEWFQGGSKLDSVKSETLKGPSVWKLYSVTATAPAGTDSARFVCKIKSVPGASGDVYFDDLEIKVIK